MSHDSQDCSYGVENRQRIISLEEKTGKMDKVITDIRDNLLTRPTWGVLIVITILSNAVVALGMELIKAHR